MKLIYCITVQAVLTGVLFTGCAREPSAVKVTDSDNNSRVQLEKGQELVVSLKANPTTGYRWLRPRQSKAGILRQKGRAEFEQTRDKPGAPGVQSFRFEATGTGRGSLVLIYHRPWQKSPPLRRFVLHVSVQ